MARLSLSLLGPLRIALDGRLVGGFAYQKARALLVYLAVEADTAHQRDTLVGLLWPELPDTAARTNLRQVLANLREVLSDASATPPFLLITRDTIQLNPISGYELDMISFTSLLDACATHGHRHMARCRSCAARMQQALAHYRGDFLAEFALGDSAPFDEWALRRREQLHQRALDALAHLADYHERRSDDEPARRYAQRQIELDPWREEAHRQIMRLLTRGGQRSAALAQYETCRRVLACDLDVEPAAETTALYEQIRGRETGRQGDKETSTQAGVQSLSLSPLSLSPSPRHNFPAHSTQLIGRESELAELGELLENPSRRLITIIGPGGIGKTRLALAAATEQSQAFTHGAAFVPLAAIGAAEFLAPAIMAALDLTLQGQRDPHDQLLDYLRGKELLLVLDNFEQLLAPDMGQNGGATDLLVDMLRHAPGVTLLVTSRERLALHGEWLFDLPGLSYPDGELIDSVESYSAVQLFLQRAGQVRRHFALVEGEARAVAHICRLVEGLPLARELAAGLRGRSCAAIADAIETNLSALTTVLRSIPERHRSMWATFEYSWGLLSDNERQVLPRLSVFRGGFTLEAAEAVCRVQEAGNRKQKNIDIAAASLSPVPYTLLPILMALVDKSLLRWDGMARYDMHELVRQYASEKLEQAGEAEGTKCQHAMYFLALAETAEPKLLSGERDHWLEQLDREHDNLRAALAWSQATVDASEIGLHLTGALHWFWMFRDYLSEGRAWAEGMFATAGGSGQPRARAKALHSAGMLAWVLCDYAVARAQLMESVQCWREIDDRRGLAFTLIQAGMVACDQTDYRAGHELCAESVAVFRELRDLWGLAYGLYLFGNAAFKYGDYAAARPIYEESFALWRIVNDAWGLAMPLNRLGNIACKQGDYTTARVLLEESLAIRRQVGQKWLIAISLEGLAEVALRQGEYQRATTRLAESLALYQELGAGHSIAEALERFAQAAAGQAQLERSARLWGAAQAYREVISAPMSRGTQLDYEYAVAVARAQLDEAAFAAAWAAGRTQTLEQAIAEALNRR